VSFLPSVSRRPFNTTAQVYDHLTENRTEESTDKVRSIFGVDISTMTCFEVKASIFEIDAK